MWQLEDGTELRRSSRVAKPTQRMEPYHQQQRLFQEGNDDKQPWDMKEESQHTSPEAEVMPEAEEIADKDKWKVLKDNQLWEKQDTDKENNQDTAYEVEATADGTAEKGLGPTDTLVQTGNPYGFQPLTMKILGRDEDKADWQDKDPNIELVKNWIKEGRQPMGTEINYRSPDIQTYRKVLSALKLRPVEGTTKTVIVKEGIMGKMMDRYCLPKGIASQVI